MDYVAVYLAQRARAKELFGTSGATHPSTEGYQPNVTARFADNTVSYWIDESYRIGPSFLGKIWNHIMSGGYLGKWLTGVDYDAVTKMFEKDREALYRWKKSILSFLIGDSKLPDSEVAAFWNAVGRFQTYFQAIKSSPAPWTFLWSALKDTGKSLAKPFDPREWDKYIHYALIGGAIYGGVQIYLSWRRK